MLNMNGSMLHTSHLTQMPMILKNKENYLGSSVLAVKSLIGQKKPKSASVTVKSMAPSYSSTNYASAAELPQSDIKTGF